MRDERSAIETRASFGMIRYANCWEDADVLADALRLRPGDRVMSIASGGDNTLALLAAGPALAIAVDLSGAQLACLALKRLAMLRLEHREFLRFLGFDSGAERVRTYRGLRGELDADARAFWDANEALIESGLIHGGRFERYFRLFRRWALPLVHSRADVRELIAEKSREARERFYSERWNTVRWRMLFRVFFSRFVMGRLGRDPEFFRYVEGSVAERIANRVAHALTALSVHDNPYAVYILTGSFGAALPAYARPETYDIIRGNLGALELFQGTTGAAIAHFGGRVDAWNLSDIFEYMGPDLFAQVAGEIVSACAPGARLAYWNMLAPRRVSLVNPAATYCEARSRELFLRDRAFFYQAFIVDEVG